MLLPHGVTVTVIRPGGTDRYGNPLPSQSHELLGCGVAPGGSTEQNHLEQTVEWDLDLLTDLDADIEEADVVMLPDDETRYQVHGRPQRWPSPLTGWKAGAVVRLKGVS